jgi:hypothetical protein
MALSPDDLLADAPVGAAVAALAERNRHHLEDMDEEEREQALDHWRELAMVVLTAARATLGDEPPEADPAEALGRAVIVLEDLGDSEVAVHASFFPQLQDLGGGEVAATPAQATAIELLESFGAD